MRRARLGLACVLTAAIAAAPGCVTRRYDVEMTRSGDRFVRHTVVTEEPVVLSNSPDPTAPPPVRKTILDRTTRIETATPDDVGGAGSVARFSTTLGTLGVYLERFRGDDDPATRTWNIRIASGELAQLLTGWLESELGGTPGFDRLRDWCQRQLRPDLENVMLYAWMGGAGGPSGAVHEFDAVARIVQYLVERGYFMVADVPRLGRASVGAHGSAVMLSVAREFLAQRMGLDANRPLPDSFSFLDTAESARESLESYIRTTDLYREAAAATGAPKPAPLDLLRSRVELLVPDLLPRLFGSGDYLTLKVNLPVAPVAGNGRWEAAAGRVVWECALPPESSTVERRGLPVIVYTAWTEPNVSEQKARFGRVILENDALAQYCVWRSGLTEAEGRSWDAAVATITAENAGVASIRALAPIRGLEDGVASEGIELLWSALDGSPMLGRQ